MESSHNDEEEVCCNIDNNEQKDTVNELADDSKQKLSSTTTDMRIFQKRKSSLKMKPVTTRNYLPLIETNDNDSENEPNTNYNTVNNTHSNTKRIVFNNINTNNNNNDSFSFSLRLSTLATPSSQAQMQSGLKSTTNNKTKKIIKLLTDNFDSLLRSTKKQNRLKYSNVKGNMLKHILKDQFRMSIHKEDMDFFSILIKTPTKKPKITSVTKKRSSLALDNHIRKLKVDMPNVEKNKVPIFTSIKMLNNYLLREYNNGENQETVKKKEEIVEKTQSIINKNKVNTLKKINKEHDYERKMTKQMTRKFLKNRQKSLRQMKTIKHIEENDTEDTKPNSKMFKKTLAIEQLNVNEYEDLSKKPNESINKNNLRHVVQLVKILKGKQDVINVNEFGYDSFKKAKEELSFDDYKSQKLLRRLGPLNFMKTVFKPSTLTKFNSVNGHYF